MRNIWIVTYRELIDRVRTKFFIIILLLGPILTIGGLYILFEAGNEGKKEVNVLVSDQGDIFNKYLISKAPNSVKYSFKDSYINYEGFQTKKDYQQYDVLIDLNHKVLTNKTVLVFYRDKISTETKMSLTYDIERRLEEITIQQVKNVSLSDFKRIKQPVSIGFRDIKDPKKEKDFLSAWAGFAFSIIIFLFITLYGMSILRSIAKDKSTRIVEIILSCTKSSNLMYGKIFGIGGAALIQFICWIVIMTFGLYFLRENWFNSIYDPSAVLAENTQLNEIVELVYNRINYQVMIPYFLCFFVLGYIFYGAIFSAIGASLGSQNDGQQFVLPILFILLLAIGISYLSIYNPESSLSQFCLYLPFTSPFTAMVQLSQGIALYKIIISILILLASIIILIRLSSRIYQNGILQFGHRLNIKQFIKWIGKN